MGGRLCRLLQSSSQSCGFLMSVFFYSIEGIESTAASQGQWRGIPCEWDPCCQDPSVVTGTPFDFAPLWKLIPPPNIFIYHSLVTMVSTFTAQNGSLFRWPANQMSVHPGVSSLCFNFLWWQTKISQLLCLCWGFHSGVPPKQALHFNAVISKISHNEI